MIIKEKKKKSYIMVYFMGATCKEAKQQHNHFRPFISYPPSHVSTIHQSRYFHLQSSIKYTSSPIFTSS